MFVLNCKCGNLLTVNWGGPWLQEYNAQLRQIAEEAGWEIKGELATLTPGVCPECRAGGKVVEVVATVAAEVAR